MPVKQQDCPAGYVRAGSGILDLMRKNFSAAMIGLVAGIDNIAAALSMGALLFAGPIASGMGLGAAVGAGVD